jgi:hypothetical protein
MSLCVLDKIDDDIDDELGRLLRQLRTMPTWTDEKKRLFKEASEVASRENYLRFTGDFRDYNVVRNGDSCLYDVPPTQRGALAAFRGERVRLICAGRTDRHTGRVFLAKPVKSTHSSTTGNNH